MKKKKKKNLLALFFKLAVISFVLFMVFSILLGMGLYLHYSKNLPKIITVKDYKPRAVTTVYDRNNLKIGEFYREKRDITPYDKIPKIVINAFVASEDGKFFEHKGIDFAGIIRAMIVNFKSGHFSQGGSTITQQVARSLLLSNEKKISRKIKEAILAGRIESHLSKHDILFLYLNQIFLGHNAYGVQAAASQYFNKEVKDLTLAEAALLAGLPQAPSKWSPYANPDKAKERQIYVLNRMVEDGYITKQEALKAANERLKLYKNMDHNVQYAPYFVEFIRRYLVSKYGADKVLDDGWKIYSTLDLEMQKIADKAVKDEIELLDKQQGFRGPIKRLHSDKEINAELEKIHMELVSSIREYIYFPELWQEFKFKNKMFVIEDREDKKNQLSMKTAPTPIEKGKRYKAIVMGINEKAQEVKIKVGNVDGVIKKDGYSWAYSGKLGSGFLRKGDMVYVSILRQGVFALEQEPSVQGSLLSFNVKDGSINAMVGGYGYKSCAMAKLQGLQESGCSEFNRAYQAKRQAGSTFKPIVYAAALDNGFTPATIIVDAPIVYDNEDEEKGGTWKPANYSKQFYGDTTFRDALIFSRNIPTTKILQDIKVSYVIDYAKNLGIESDMPRDLSLGLGSTSVSLWEMTKAFGVFANGGKRTAPFFIFRVEDRDGNIIEEYDPSKPYDPLLDKNFAEEDEKLREEQLKLIEDKKAKQQREEAQEEALKEFEEDEEMIKQGIEGKKYVDDPVPAGHVISPRTAYIMNMLLKDAATRGTGAQAGAAVGVPLAGKTGTSNDFTDAWFIGYTPDVVTGVWVGYDDQSKTLGEGRTGAEVAIPIWIPYMKYAVSKYPKSDFAQPQGINMVKIDGYTGRVASMKSQKVLVLPFKTGSEPTRVEGEYKPEDADETRFFRENY